MIFEQGPPTQERDNHQTCKHSRELSLGLRSSKGIDKVFVAQRSRASNHVYRLRFLRENLIIDDNPEITKTWTLLQDSALPHSHAYRGQKGDNYGTTQITSIHAYIKVLSEHFETLNPISLNGYYEAQSSYITSSHLQQHHYTYQAKHGGKALLSFVSFLLSRWISLQNKFYLHLAIQFSKG